MPDLLGVELARVGTWDLAEGGRTTFGIGHFADAVMAAEEYGAPIIRPGHSDPRFDGEPALGRVENMRLVGDRLVGDLIDLPAWLAPRIAAAFPSRSIEGYMGVIAPSGQRYSMVITGLALLGVTPPAMAGLADLSSAIAAGALRIAAASDVMGLADGPASATPSDPPAIVPVPDPTGEPMPDLSALRQALGLGDDVSDEDVMAAAATAATERSTLQARVTELEAAEPPTPTEPPAPTPPAIPDGAVLIDAARLAELEANAQMGVAAAARQRQDDEDRFIAYQRSIGRLAPASNPAGQRLEASLRREWQRNPGEAEAIAASLAVVAPTAPVGHDGGADSTGEDALLASLWPTGGAS